MFSTFSDLRNYLRKGTFGVYFSAAFSNSLNMKRRRVLPLSDSLNFDDIGFSRDDVIRVSPSYGSLNVLGWICPKDEFI